MKLDLGRAWNEATAMIAANRDLLAIVAGLFIFLPNLALALFLPAPPAAATGGTGTQAAEQAFEAMGAFYAQYGLVFFLVALVQAIGTLALYALLAERRPTVGEAIKIGALALIPYILAQLLFIVPVAILVAIIAGLGAAGVQAAAVLVGIVAVVLIIYLIVKLLVLLSPIVVIEQVRNPIAALKRGWTLTKGNSLRIFAFLALLLVAMAVVAIVIGLITQVLAAILGEGTVGLLVAGILNAAFNAIVAVILVAVTTAIYRQLAGPSTTRVSETFE